MCLYPKVIFNPKYKANQKNGGNIPPVHDKRVLGVPVGCGNCMECRKKKAREWQVRLSEDIKTNTNGKFITLTFSTESLQDIGSKIDQKWTGYDRENEIATYAIRHFLERWRKATGKSVRHWLITELGHGSTEHLHLHGILWTNESIDFIENKWQYGYIHRQFKDERIVNYVNDQTINYLIKYVHKQDIEHKEYKPKMFCSAGIGGGYVRNKFRRILSILRTMATQIKGWYMVIKSIYQKTKNSNRPRRAG